MNFTYWSRGTAASLTEILDAREKRAALQQQMLKDAPASLVCLTLNIVGPVKSFPFARRLYEAGREALLKTAALLSGSVTDQAEQAENTGYEGCFALTLPPETIKSALLEIEEAHPLGRLFDFDVLRPDGTKVSRQESGFPARTCLLCQNPAFLCGRSRRHSAQELFQKERSMMNAFFEERLSVHLGLLLQKALFYEVNTFLKPGLVDSVHSGAHQDMNRETFIKSAYALTPYFIESARLGLSFDGGDEELPTLFSLLRKSGKEAETLMKKTTQGVNTHKGMIFSGGIFCCALGYLISNDGIFPEEFSQAALDRLASVIQAMVQGILSDYHGKKAVTHGEQLYLAYRLEGIRGEAKKGFPSVLQMGFPFFLERKKEGFSLNQCGCLTLLQYLAVTEDTNLYARAGYPLACKIQEKLSAFLSSASYESHLAVLPDLDRYFVEKNISPGGSADMLSLTYFLYFLMKKPCEFT